MMRVFPNEVVSLLVGGRNGRGWMPSAEGALGLEHDCVSRSVWSPWETEEESTQGPGQDSAVAPTNLQFGPVGNSSGKMCPGLSQVLFPP